MVAVKRRRTDITRGDAFEVYGIPSPKRRVPIPKRRSPLSSPTGTKKTMNLIGSLMRTLENHQFEDQLEKTAKHLGMSKKEVLTTILGR